MYNTFDKSERIFVYRFNKSKEAYELVKVCESKDEFVKYAAKTVNVWHRRHIPGKDRLPIVDDVDLTGKDKNREHSYDYYTVWYGEERYFLPYIVNRTFNKAYIIYDGMGRIVNPSDMRKDIEREIQAERDFFESKKYKRNRWWSRYDNYEFRRGPVPYIHKYKGGGCGRDEKVWFHNYRIDHIPEYKDYVRHKACVPDVWDTEPFVETTKNWKKQAKCRHQWGKHKMRRKDTVKFDKRYIQEEDPWMYYGDHLTQYSKNLRDSLETSEDETLYSEEDILLRELDWQILEASEEKCELVEISLEKSYTDCFGEEKTDVFPVGVYPSGDFEDAGKDVDESLRLLWDDEGSVFRYTVTGFGGAFSANAAFF